MLAGPGRRRGRRRGLVVGMAAGSAMARRGNSQAADDSEPTAAPQEDTAAQLTELKNLADQGLITQEEYAAKKASILGL